MALVDGQCPACQSLDVGQYGQQAHGTQRYRCTHRDGPRTLFLLPSHDNGRLPAGQQPVVAMTRNGRGVRERVRVLQGSAATVIDVLKKSASHHAGERKTAPHACSSTG